ncbi:MAG: Cell division membrane protein [Microgenomates group bacterium Gr01-1014_16]|nr:MAG: Cell division membrane protein [Microgenomates group bacterium Gr01-1014_16]
MASVRLLVVLIVSLAIFGLIMVASSSVVTAQRDFSDRWFYLKLQSVWTALGLVGLVIVSKINPSYWEKPAPFLYITSLILLLVVLIPGIGLKLLGARRWLDLGLFSFQPAELAKLSLIMYLSAFLKAPPASRFLQFLVLLALPVGLILFQPDLGTALILAGIGLAVYFVAGGRWLHFFGLVPLAIACLTLFIIISPYRLARLRTYFDSSHDPLGSSYQVRQALISLGSGGLFGRGLGQSRQKYEFLPEVTTDSIFAVIGEEFGLLGTLLVLSAFWLLIHLGFQASAAAPSPFTRNLAAGISSWLGIQTFLNLSSQVALTPLTGVPLPLVSYGGSSLVVLLLASGILISISRHEKTSFYRRPSH